MIKTIITVLLFLISFTSISQQNLKYFDREMIDKHKINKIYEMISFDVNHNFKMVRSDNYYSFAKQDIGTPWRACRNDYYVFDDNSNIQYRKNIGREGTFYFEYNDMNEMVNYYTTLFPFENLIKDINFKKYLAHDSDLFEKILSNYQKPLDLLLSSKTDYTQPHFYNIRSSCSGIRARYKITIVKEKDGLPILLKGQFVEYLLNTKLFAIGSYKDLDSNENEYVGASYNKDISIYYHYKFYD